MLTNNNNKVDLLGFQKSLNEQFLEIFESKKLGQTGSLVDSTSRLGLLDQIDNFNFFLPLKELKNISMTNTFEEVNLSRSWVCGFNQVRGEVFTILDLNKILDLFYSNKTDNQVRKMSGDNRIVYLKKYNESSIGLIINQLLLEYTADYTPIFKGDTTDGVSTWTLAEDVEFESFVKAANMSEKEYKLINKINEFVKTSKNVQTEDLYKEVTEKSHEEIFYSLIGNVYLDNMGKRPIFTLNIENLTKVLVNVSTF